MPEELGKYWHAATNDTDGELDVPEQTLYKLDSWEDKMYNQFLAERVSQGGRKTYMK